MAKGKLKSPLWELQNRENRVGECERCKKISHLTVDHIFPVSLLSQWGLTEDISWDKDNMQLICKKCQVLKRNNFDFHNPKTIYLIEKYINKIKKLNEN